MYWLTEGYVLQVKRVDLYLLTEGYVLQVKRVDLYHYQLK